MIKTLQNRFEQGYRTSRYPKEPIQLPARYRGRPQIAQDAPADVVAHCAGICPQEAINAENRCIDLARCVFCGACERASEGRFVSFSRDFEMSKDGVSGVGIFALLLALFGLAYMFVLEPMLVPARETSWAAYRETDFNVSDGEWALVPELNIEIDNTPAGMIVIQFYTMITNEPLGNTQYRVKAGTSVVHTSQLFGGSIWDNTHSNCTVFLKALAAGKTNITVEVVGEKPTSGIYNATLLVNYYSY